MEKAHCKNEEVKGKIDAYRCVDTVLYRRGTGAYRTVPYRRDTGA